MDFVFHDAPLETIFPIVFSRLIITGKNMGMSVTNSEAASPGA